MLPSLMNETLSKLSIWLNLGTQKGHVKIIRSTIEWMNVFMSISGLKEIGFQLAMKIK